MNKAAPPETSKLAAHENLGARRVIEATIRDAHHAADLVTVALREAGYKSAKRRKDSEEKAAEGPMIHKAKVMLLNLGATLRIAEWERAGVKSCLPATLPDSLEALGEIIPDDGVKLDTSQPFSVAVLKTLLTRFTLSGRAELGADVLLECAGLDKDELLDALADLLWQHRHLANDLGKN